ncbi:nucleotidyl transferase AbiEii/AbiGii toxin family protein [Janibacter melonis]|uniref:nucleotidyl transferase AbiEii/AbiGii toxin family protein n=1 Tax=Janibacter melonis TaxID=262209 RepID=UPI002044BD48|nr:nucleotidyl transferase AbiEii/AbiGii toxin family protein [Janibacter melonis]MCM3555212.1 nucleotidyl transferase AbiEii/AbiGii toxin family protein [Janibacter melonis]
MSVDRALRDSINHRLANVAAERRVAPDRVRRHFAFQRILVRLSATEGWVLKGGFALEVRLGLQARATKDLDLAMLDDLDGAEVHDRLLDALDVDADDALTFQVSAPKAISPDEAGNPGWKFTVTSFLGGKVFAPLRLDVVARSAEIAGAVGTLEVHPPILPERLSSTTMPAVDVAQHAAEKFHAMARTYAGDRPSSRVKDLVDVVLLADAGLLPHPDLPDRLRTVWQVRDGVPPPAQLPELPASWSRDYAAMATELDLDIDYLTARSTAERIYAEALATKEIQQ